MRGLGVVFVIEGIYAVLYSDPGRVVDTEDGNRAGLVRGTE